MIKEWQGVLLACFGLSSDGVMVEQIGEVNEKGLVVIEWIVSSASELQLAPGWEGVYELNRSEEQPNHYCLGLKSSLRALLDGL